MLSLCESATVDADLNVTCTLLPGKVYTCSRLVHLPLEELGYKMIKLASENASLQTFLTISFLKHFPHGPLASLLTVLSCGPPAVWCLLF